MVISLRTEVCILRTTAKPLSCALQQARGGLERVPHPSRYITHHTVGTSPFRILCQRVSGNILSSNIRFVPATESKAGQVSGHDLSVQPDASAAAKAAKSCRQKLGKNIPCAAGSRAAAPSKPDFGLMDEVQRSAHFTN
jgi:hypothetical protein